jgi:hypothetical protein
MIVNMVATGVKRFSNIKIIRGGLEPLGVGCLFDYESGSAGIAAASYLHTDLGSDSDADQSVMAAKNCHVACDASQPSPSPIMGRGNSICKL